MLYHRVSVNGKEEANFRTPHDSKYSFRHVGARGWLDFIPTLKRTYTFWVRQQHREMFLFLQWTPTLTLSFFLVVVVRNTNRDSSLWYILATGVSDWSDWSGDSYCQLLLFYPQSQTVARRSFVIQFWQLIETIVSGVNTDADWSGGTRQRAVTQTTSQEKDKN